MNDSVRLDIQLEEFESFHGGIYRWLDEFVDRLVDVGTDGFFQHFQENVAPLNRRLQDHLHFLKKGIKTIDKTALENAIVAVRDLWQRKKDLSYDYDQNVRLLEQVEKDWHATTGHARAELELWEKWANETEAAQREKCFSFHRYNVNRRTIFGSYWASDLLSSPKKLQDNISSFEKQIDAIQSLISGAYIFEALPTGLDCSAFDRAIDNLMESHQHSVVLSSEVSRLSDEWESVSKSYASQKMPLYKLLDQMPNSARWALFRIYREYLVLQKKQSTLSKSD